MSLFAVNLRSVDMAHSTRCLGPYVTTTSETVVAFAAPITQGRAFYSHLVVMAQAEDSSAALMFNGDYVTRRAVGGDVTVACARAQTDEDFSNPPPSVSVAVNLATQSVELRLTGKPNTTVKWLGLVDSFWNLT